MKRIIIMVLCIGQVVTIRGIDMDFSRGSGEIRSNDGSVSHDHQNNPSLFLMREIQKENLEKMKTDFGSKKSTFSKGRKEDLDAWHTRLKAIKDEEVVELPTQKILAIKDEGESVSFIDRIHSRFGLRKKNLNQIENEINDINKEINGLKEKLKSEIEENKNAKNKNIMKKTSVIIKQIDRLLKNKKALIQEADSIVTKRNNKRLAAEKKSDAIAKKKEKKERKEKARKEWQNLSREEQQKALKAMRDERIRNSEPTLWDLFVDGFRSAD